MQHYHTIYLSDFPIFKTRSHLLMKYLSADFYKEMTVLKWVQFNFPCLPFQNLLNFQQIKVHLNFKAFQVKLKGKQHISNINKLKDHFSICKLHPHFYKTEKAKYKVCKNKQYSRHSRHSTSLLISRITKIKAWKKSWRKIPSSVTGDTMSLIWKQKYSKYSENSIFL